MNRATLISMKHEENKMFQTTGCKSIGFVFPIHYLKIPVMVQEFIRSLKLKNVGYTYAVVNYKGWEMNALYDLEQLLKEKGIHLEYAVLHKNVNSDLTSSNRSAYNIEQNVKAEMDLQKIIDDILNQKKKAAKRNPLKGMVNQWAQHLSTAHEISSDRFSVNDTCDLCGRCQLVCCNQNVNVENGTVHFLDVCKHCYTCIQYCPKEAINITGVTEENGKYHHPFISYRRMARPYLKIENGNIAEVSDKNSPVTVDSLKNFMIK